MEEKLESRLKKDMVGYGTNDVPGGNGGYLFGLDTGNTSTSMGRTRLHSASLLSTFGNTPQDSLRQRSVTAGTTDSLGKGVTDSSQARQRFPSDGSDSGWYTLDEGGAGSRGGGSPREGAGGGGSEEVLREVDVPVNKEALDVGKLLASRSDDDIDNQNGDVGESAVSPPPYYEQQDGNGNTNGVHTPRSKNASSRKEGGVNEVLLNNNDYSLDRLYTAATANARYAEILVPVMSLLCHHQDLH